MGTYQFPVAEACSGLRYMFPIMRLTYIFAAFYRGATRHKAAAFPVNRAVIRKEREQLLFYY